MNQDGHYDFINNDSYRNGDIKDYNKYDNIDDDDDNDNDNVSKAQRFVLPVPS